MAASGSTTVVVIALAGNGCLAVLKLVAAAVTGSAAMLAEAVHSIAGTANLGLLLFGIRRANRAPGAGRPLGHGMEVYFWAFVVAILLFSMGAGIAIYEGIDKLQRPRSMTSPGVNFAVLGVAAVFETGWLWLAIRQIDRNRAGEATNERRQLADPALYTVLLEGIAAIAGLLVAFVGTFASHALGWVQGDALAAIAVGLILGGVAALMSLQIKGLLIGEAAPPEAVDAIRTFLRQEIGKDGPVTAIDKLRIMQVGPGQLVVAAELTFRDSEPARTIAVTAGRLEQGIRQRFPFVRHLFLEVQPSADAVAPTVGRQGAGMTDAGPIGVLEGGSPGATMPTPGGGAVEVATMSQRPPRRGKPGKR